MGKITGFIELQRIQEAALPAAERVQHYREFVLALADDEASKQGARCMDCGIPFCQSGCPVNNIIPDWNDLVYRQQWRDGARRAALDQQLSRSSPAASARRRARRRARSTSTTIRSASSRSSTSSSTRAGRKAGSSPQPPAREDRQARRGRRLRARRGSPARSSSRAPATTSCVFEKADRIGGLLRYGIPDFKMEKHLIDRRMAQMSIEGVEFRPERRTSATTCPAQRRCSPSSTRSC